MKTVAYVLQVLEQSKKNRGNLQYKSFGTVWQPRQELAGIIGAIYLFSVWLFSKILIGYSQ